MALKDIEKKIISDAESEAQKIKRTAGDSADALIKEKEKELDKRESLAIRQAQKDGEVARIEIVSPAKISAKNELLTKKQEMVSGAYKDALTDIKKLGEKSYKLAMTSLLRSLPKGVSGEIIPRSGKESVTRKAVASFLREQKKAVSLSVKKGRKDISGGFIFKSQKFNVDFSFETILSGIKDRTESKVSAQVLERRGG
jgi:vacuolar-type H+-ATPase subunit E/Vma4